VRTGSAIDARGRYLVSNDSLENYRAIVAELDYSAGQPVTLDAAMCTALKVNEGSLIRLIAL
jgi:arginine N-succinyltransferase